nr:MFS transporter [Rhizohabitans arisaemae]
MRMFRSLRHRGFRIFAGGFTGATTAMWMQRVAQDWLTLELTGSGIALGAVTALQFTPILLFSLWGGVIADRYPRRRVLIWTHILMGAQAGLLGLLVATGTVQMWHVYLLALLFGATTAVDQPVRQAYVGDIVPADRLPNAIALTGALFNVGRVVGPALSGLAIAFADSTWPVLVANGLLYGLVAVVWAFTLSGTTEAGPTRGSAGKPRLREGLTTIRSDRDLVLVFTVIGVVSLFGLNFSLTTALMATAEFGRGPDAYGLLSSTLACGAFAGALIAARLERPGPRRVVAAAAVFGVLEVVSGAMPTYAAFMAALLPIGVAMLVLTMTTSTVVQVSADPAVRGRVVGFYYLVVFGTNPLGGLMTGWLSETFGPRSSLILGGAVSVAIALTAALVLRRRAPAPTVEPSEPAP